MLFEWTDRYSVKVKEIDDQHKKLINNINELHEAIGAGEGSEVLEDILKNLLDYTYTHFATEENLMKIHGYPDYEDHKKEHNYLNKKVILLKKKHQSEDSLIIPIHTMKFLKDWLSHHILEIDKKYSGFFNEKGVT